MIENRDKLINDLQERKEYYKQMAEQQRENLLEQDEIFKEILELVSGNTYNNTEAITRKVKELVQTAIRN